MLRPLGARLVVMLTLSLGLSSRAAAQESVFGYQLALTQSASTVVTDDQALLGLQFQEVDQPTVSQLQGLQLNTGVNANLTLDVLTRSLEHGFLIGAGFNQTVPTLTPEGAVQNAISGLNGTASYLARLQRARWGLAFGGSYTVASNGRLRTAADGGAAGQGGQAGFPANTLPGSDFGPFVVNGITHGVNARTQLQLIRTRWDLDVEANYAFTSNGIFTLAPGGLGGQAAGQTALGTFLPLTTHNISPRVGHRLRIGRDHLVFTNLSAGFVLPARATPQELPNPDDPNTPFLIVPIQPVGPSILNQADTGYLYEIGDNHRIGVGIGATFNLRRPLVQVNNVFIDTAGNERNELVFAPSETVGYAADTFIYSAQATYFILIRALELGVNLSAGIAQPRLWQFPIGQGNGEIFETPAAANIEPIFTLALNRRFEPLDATLSVTRNVAVGGLGASAIVTENANLVLGYQIPFSRRPDAMTLNLAAGLTAARIRGAGREFLPDLPAAGGNAALLLAALTDNNNVGAVASAGVTLLESGPFRVDSTLMYSFAYNDLNPRGVEAVALVQESITTHNVILTLLGSFGRGALQNPDGERGELDAFSRNPSTGSPLTSARLRNAGMNLEGTSGSAPGRAPEERRDSREAYRRMLETEQAEAAQATRSAEAGASTGIPGLVDTGEELDRPEL